MTNKVIKTVKEHSMVSKGDTVGVGLSGGADSVTLLHILVNNKEKLGISKIKGIHIHHGIRGDEADRDLNFSKNFCEKLGVEFVYYYADVPAEAKKTGESIEECARRIRYDLFSKSGCTKIATAHNLNDNMETVIFNMTRGTSVSGLCGIPYVRDIYIRPLLDCTRNEIEEYLKENALEFVTDSTNLSDDYTRNKIRHLVIPELKSINTNVEDAFSRFSESVRDDVEFLENLALDAFKQAEIDKNTYSVNILNSFHKSIKNRVIFKAINKDATMENMQKKIQKKASNLSNGILSTLSYRSICSAFSTMNNSFGSKAFS